jgi:epsilon-lactone hydrolase
MFSDGPGMDKALAKYRQKPPQPNAPCHKAAQWQKDIFERYPVWTITPHEAAPVATIVFWHGGGYVYPPMDAHWAFLAHMAEKHHWRIIAPLYPLAPEHQAQEATAHALRLWAHVANQYTDTAITMMGDSAGAGLTAAVTMMARDAGMPLPAKLVLICPWLNTVPDHPDQPKIEPRDAILTLSGIRKAGQIYAGPLPANDPRISPIYGNWSGMPPIQCFAGGDDILVTDARALKAKCPDISYQEMAGMIHDWPIFIFAESRLAQREMAAFVGGMA